MKNPGYAENPGYAVSLPTVTSPDGWDMAQRRQQSNRKRLKQLTVHLTSPDGWHMAQRTAEQSKASQTTHSSTCQHMDGVRFGRYCTY